MDNESLVFFRIEGGYDNGNERPCEDNHQSIISLWDKGVMTMETSYRLSAGEMDTLFAKLAENYLIYAPVRIHNGGRYALSFMRAQSFP